MLSASSLLPNTSQCHARPHSDFRGRLLSQHEVRDLVTSDVQLNGIDNRTCVDGPTRYSPSTSYVNLVLTSMKAGRDAIEGHLGRYFRRRAGNGLGEQM